ncbi:Aox4 [Symbiodinium natans]|uniref:Aox4 protein n=1 Tax=Symbiodinium natans TaxID=878477 RepID=A0A812KHQ9_9DINO|nr:Aox4 [Symbiodinium natans]
MPEYLPPPRNGQLSSEVLRFHLNGELVEVIGADPRQLLIEFLRDSKGLTGTKRSCLQGGCGACVVAIQEYDPATSQWRYRSVNSCLKPLVACHGTSITTVEGVGTERKCLHQVQKRIAENHGMQCGFCTPGMVMNTYALLRAGGKPTAEESMQNYDGNICRCTGYRNLVQASESFASDASPEAEALAQRCGHHDANLCDKLSGVEHKGMDRVLKSVQFTKDDFTWYAPMSLQEVLQIKQEKPRAMYIVGDTAKGIRQAAYEVANGRATDVIALRNAALASMGTATCGGLTIGGALTIQHITDALEKYQKEHSGLQWPTALAEAVKNVAQHHLRSEAGWAGNLLITVQRGFPSDLFPALLAADAEVSYVTKSTEETRIPLSQFKPGAVPFNALLTKLHIPNLQGSFYKYFRVGQRKWLSHCFAGGGFRVVLDSAKKVTEARVCSYQAESALVGATLDTETLQKAIAALHQELEFAGEAQFQTIDNPEGKEILVVQDLDAYRRQLPDSYVFKFFKEAQAFFGIKQWPAEELGSLALKPLKAGQLTFQEQPGLDNKPQLSAMGMTTGSVKYTDDQPMPGLFGYPVLSEVATGKLEHLDTMQAFKVDGVVDIVTAVDVPGKNDCGFAPGAIITLDQAIAAESFLDGAHFKNSIDKGDLEAGYKSSDLVFEGSTYVIGQHAFPMEKQTALAVPEEKKGMTECALADPVSPCTIRLAGVLGIPGSFVVCKQTRAGGMFKPSHFDSSHFDRCDIESWCNGGCTHDFTGFLNLEMGEAIPSVYDWPNMRVNVHAMKTNTPSNTAVRSFGSPQGYFVCEAIIEDIAGRLGKVVEEIREINMCTKQNAVTPWGQPMEYYNDATSVDTLWKKLKQDAKYEERAKTCEEFNKANRWRKRAISAVPLAYGHCYAYAAGTGALVNIHGSDGSVTVHHGGCEIGQGIHTKVAQVVAISLGCPLDLVRVADTNSEVVPNARFTGGSITTEVVCEAARQACKQLLQTLKPHREFLKKRDDKDPSWPELVAAANTVLGHQEKLSATGIFAPTGNKYTTDVEGNTLGKHHGDYFTYGAGVSEVELDVLTGEVRTLRSDILYDVGQSINPGIDIGQLEGAFVWGIGYYMYEEPLRDTRGVERSQGVWAYKPPMAAEVPVEFRVELLRDNPFPKGVLGSKAIGEPPFMLAYSVLGAAKKAIASARKDAGLSEHFKLPMPCTLDAIHQAGVWG